MQAPDTFEASNGQFWLAVLVQIIALALVLGWWWARSLPYSPVELTGTAPNSSQRLPCVSYAPFRHADINPFNPTSRVSAAQIEVDLRIVQTRSNCVRTYGLAQGLDAVPAVAAKLGMRVKLGVWLTRDAAQNQIEVDKGIALARQFPGTVDLLIVGNEVLLRREMTASALASVLDYARQHASVPVTYADVWEFWLRHAQLARHVNIVTIHILPYWEDEPVAVDKAVSHVLAIAAKVQRQFGSQPVWVGETGWPAAGRQRGAAVPGGVAQSRFVRELLASTQAAASAGTVLDYNVIEAFDQPWKRAFEGAMGGYWGLFDQFGQARVALTGSVVEDSRWWRGWVAALAGGAFFTALGAWLTRNRRLRLACALMGATLGALAPLQWLMVQQWDRTLREQAVSLVLALLGVVVCVGLPLCTLRAGCGPIARFAQYARFAYFTRLALFFAAATAALVLLLDSRYRPFAWWWFLAPTATLVALRMAGLDAANLFNLPTTRTRLLAAIVAVCALGVLVVEGPQNTQAWFYGALMLVLAAVAWPSRAQASTASNAAGAHISVV